MGRGSQNIRLSLFTFLSKNSSTLVDYLQSYYTTFLFLTNILYLKN